MGKNVYSLVGTIYDTSMCSIIGVDKTRGDISGVDNEEKTLRFKCTAIAAMLVILW